MQDTVIACWAKAITFLATSTRPLVYASLYTSQQATCITLDAIAGVSGRSSLAA